MAEDRLKKIDDKIAQLHAQKQAILNREKGRDRKIDTRKKILVGSVVLGLVKRGDWPEDRLLNLLDLELSLDRDRLLFDLSPKNGSAKQDVPVNAKEEQQRGTNV